jgi:Tol biopolymer transport system component/PKD repeat protein
MGAQIRFRILLLCALGLIGGSVSAQDDLSQMSYTIRTLYCGDSIFGYVCEISTSVTTPWSGHAGSESTWSPNGEQIAFTNAGDIFITSQGVFEKNLTGTHNNWSPAWAPDGRQIVFVSRRDGRPEIYLMSPVGSDVVRLTTNVASAVDRPAWSPDSRRIAFNCEIEVANQDICAIDRNGSGFTRLTTDPAADTDPAWSPDGTKILFSSTRFDGTTPMFALMDPNGRQLSLMGSGIAGSRAAWSPDGTRIAFSWYAPDSTPDVPKFAIYTVAPDGTSETFLGGGAPVNNGGYGCDVFCGEPFDGGAVDPVWMPGVPVAAIDYKCSQLSCSFDGSRSLNGYSTISDYRWDFGDGQTATGTTTTHTYAAAGTFSVRLTVTNTNLIDGVAFLNVTVPPPTPPPTIPPPNIPPSVAIMSPVAGASFAEPATIGISATASDPDGTISSVRFYVNSSLVGSSTVAPYAVPSATTLAAGTYTLTAVATDNAGATTTSAGVTIYVLAPPIASFKTGCVGLTCTFDGSSSKGNSNSYFWDFGDRTSLTSDTAAVVTHTYTRAGTYLVTLKVANPVGASTISQEVRVVRRK